MVKRAPARKRARKAKPGTQVSGQQNANWPILRERLPRSRKQSRKLAAA